ncbi:UTP--glucose-1-phosphate uridylyltransferase [Candidatus Uhrbacteria bacterium CG10_big_fil_rev_8_21_14_0_10_48_11]|uniref:UTP--glucose-1-phosphate uridylyltransferase n=1 Tax=Candidatus Uhrbacteria bacterium CG10_big_fil_rev_8_21_14_0_10_48_11 TaxID=1975037 RepID=A0A2M8LEX1_9BACT|nr:MAG: UTP--glucose-1-phosphate uridylyltransferase [Candidatus Uhrbacteria bacterium CG10_big_fil_rev_8_21_14_0_10_48_11]
MQQITKAVIPAAGFGTRFLPATKAQPKEMLTLVDKPVIQYVVEEAVASGIKDIIIITGQSKRAIEDHFDRNLELETRLRHDNKRKALKEIQRLARFANFIYIRQPEPLGDGHAILEAYNLLKNEPFAMLYGDEIIQSKTPCLAEVIKIYEEFSAPVITVSKIPRQQVSRFGIIGGEQIRPNLHLVNQFIEKPSLEIAPSRLANIGRAIITPNLLKTLKGIKVKKGSELRIADAFARYQKNHPLYAYTHSGKRLDCGDKLGFLKATVDMGLAHPELKGAFRSYLKRV